MTEINRIDYSAWANKQLAQIAKSVDKNGVQGLQGKEIFDFVREAKNQNIEKADIYEQIGLNLSKTRAASKVPVGEKSQEFAQAIDYYNTEMDSRERYSVTQRANNKLTERLGKLEQDINKAYQDCAAFNDSDIMVVLSSPFRYYTYPRWRDRLINFDIAEMRERTTKDMDSLNEIKEKTEAIIAEAKGETEYKKPQKIEYDVDAIAQKHLGMSYEEFAAKYSKELENCKYVTYADLHLMDETQAYVYDRAKAYAAEMLEITMNEAHNVHWDIQERKMYEAIDAASDIYVFSEFEYFGIDDDGLASMQSGISYKAFEDALIEVYNEVYSAGISSPEADAQPKNPIKRVVNGAVLIFNPNGTVYDLKGNRIK